MELPFKKGVRGHHSQMEQLIEDPDVHHVFSEPQVFVCLDFWVHLDDEARTEGCL